VKKLAVVLVFALSVLGCSDRSNPRPTRGVVGQVTGDPDDEVSPQLQAQVGAALARGEHDDPVDF
jgi:hypothetical protein